MGCFNLNWKEDVHLLTDLKKYVKSVQVYKTFYGKMYKNGKFIKNISEKKFSNYKNIKLIKDNISAYKSLEKKTALPFFINEGLFAKNYMH